MHGVKAGSNHKDCAGEFHAIWEGILTSLDQPYFQWINTNLITIQSVGIENKSYIGLVAAIGLVAIGINALKNRFKASLFAQEGKREQFLQLGFWAAFVLLVFAHGIPFTINGFAFLLDYAGPIRQFRSVGRFAWVFYYVANLCV